MWRAVSVISILLLMVVGTLLASLAASYAINYIYRTATRAIEPIYISVEAADSSRFVVTLSVRNPSNSQAIVIIDLRDLFQSPSYICPGATGIYIGAAQSESPVIDIPPPDTEEPIKIYGSPGYEYISVGFDPGTGSPTFEVRPGSFGSLSCIVTGSLQKKTSTYIPYFFHDEMTIRTAGVRVIYR